MQSRGRETFIHIGKVSRLLPLFLVFALAPISHAGTLDFSTVGLFPKNVGEFGYADLSQARQFSWFPQFEAQLVPVSLYGFEQFLQVAQMKQTPSIDQVAWGRLLPEHPTPEKSDTAGSGEIIGVAIGNFDADAIQSFLGSHNIPALPIGNYLAYGAGTGSGSTDVFFALIDSDTIAFGSLTGLKRILSVRRGDEENLLENEEMMGVLSQANGDGMFWGILDSAGARTTIQRLVPGVANFSHGRDVISGVKHILITVRAPGDIELDLQAASASSGDAVLLSQLLQAGVLYRRYQAIQDHSDLAHALDGVRITASGTQLELSVNLTDDQVLSLIEQNLLSLPM